MDKTDHSTQSGQNFRTREPSTSYVERRCVHQMAHDWFDAPAADWPDDLLTNFSLRMARHGMSISRTQMRNDPAYAQQQISHARELDDTSLHQLADRFAEMARAHATAH